VIGGLDHERVLREIAAEAGWSTRYALMIIISLAISLLGLLMPSVAVLIGAMLISPLMMPIIGLGFGIAVLDFTEIRRSLVALAAGALIAVVLAAMLVALSPVQTITGEIAGRTRPTLFDLLVAFFSAIAGGYALIRGRGGTVVGVAIAIALMPPLAVVGFGIATWNGTVFYGALLLFVTNLVTIALTAALVARLYGFGGHLSRHHTRWQLFLFAASLAALSVPLGSALKQIAFESAAQRQVRSIIATQFPEMARLSQLELDFNVKPMRVRAVVLTPALDPHADGALSGLLKEGLGRPVDFHVDQIRTSMETGQTEAAQIAKATESRPSIDAEVRDVVGTLSLLSGAAAEQVQVGTASRTLRVRAAKLVGLGLEGIMALEQRAEAALPGWRVLLSPPETAAILPEVGFDEGVVDARALDLAGWASKRLDREILVRGGNTAQRRAVAEGIEHRGGIAHSLPDTGGRLSLEWAPHTTTGGSVDESRRVGPADPFRSRQLVPQGEAQRR
jgi:uncharacterized hydrophobic protein (TIGR00271 family)